MGKSQRKGDFCNGVQPQPFIPLDIVDPIFKTRMALEKSAFYKFSKKNSPSQMSTTLFPSRHMANFIKKSNVLKFHYISMASPWILCKSKRYSIIIVSNNSHL
jgi:hypothetical protein